MYLKLLAITIVLTTSGASMLVWRAERVRMQRETAVIHEEIRNTQERIWREDVKLSEELKAEAIRDAADEIHLELEHILEEDVELHIPERPTMSQRDEHSELRRVNWEHD